MVPDREHLVESIKQITSLSVNMKDYVDVNIALVREYIKAEMFSLRGSVDKSETQLQHRLATMNEFREALRDQASKFTTRTEVELMLSTVQQSIKERRTEETTTFDGLEARLRKQEEFRANFEGRMLVLAGVWGTVLLVIDFLIRLAFPNLGR